MCKHNSLLHTNTQLHTRDFVPLPIIIIILILSLSLSLPLPLSLSLFLSLSLSLSDNRHKASSGLNRRTEMYLKEHEHIRR